MLSDEQLMMEFQAGEAKAFEELFERYRNPIYGFFRRRLSSTHLAEDMAQETFIVILRGVEKYEPRAKFRTYLYAIALKLLWSERRKEVREAQIKSEPIETHSKAQSPDGGWIREMLEQLDAPHREVLMLREYEELSYDEIAELLKIPINTVRSRLFRARGELKVLLEAQTTKGALR
jgi:RNA polymerase sigma-70 factor (ECF subfamily)